MCGDIQSELCLGRVGPNGLPSFQCCFTCNSLCSVYEVSFYLLFILEYNKNFEDFTRQPVSYLKTQCGKVLQFKNNSH